MFLRSFLGCILVIVNFWNDISVVRPADMKVGQLLSAKPQKCYKLSQ